MTEEQFHKRADTLSKLLVPVVIAIGGVLYSQHQSTIDKNRTDEEKASETKRVDAQKLAESAQRDLELDTAYIRMLVSSNKDERTLGINIIKVLVANHKFSSDLTPVLVLAAGQKDDPLTVAANQIIALPGAQQQLTAGPASPSASTSAIEVFVQIAREDQRLAATRLQAELRKAGYATPGVQLVDGAVSTVHTYVRFFSATGALQASKVNSVLKQMGYSQPGVQDFSGYVDRPSPFIEVWIGKNQGELPQPAAQ